MTAQSGRPFASRSWQPHKPTVRLARERFYASRPAPPYTGVGWCARSRGIAPTRRTARAGLRSHHRSRYHRRIARSAGAAKAPARKSCLASSLVARLLMAKIRQAISTCSVTLSITKMPDCAPLSSACVQNGSCAAKPSSRACASWAYRWAGKEFAVWRPEKASAARTSRKPLVEAGHVQTNAEAFERYLRNGGPAHVPRWRLSAASCITLIQAAGGLAVIAHPASCATMSVASNRSFPLGCGHRNHPPASQPRRRLPLAPLGEKTWSPNDRRFRFSSAGRGRGDQYRPLPGADGVRGGDLRASAGQLYQRQGILKASIPTGRKRRNPAWLA